MQRNVESIENAHIEEKTLIEEVVNFGDSLSDMGTMDKRKLFGFIPMAWLSGLKGKSAKGSFTNGFPWSKAIAAALVDEFIIKSEEKNGHFGSNRNRVLDAADIGDEILTHDPAFRIRRKSQELVRPLQNQSQTLVEQEEDKRPLLQDVKGKKPAPQLKVQNKPRSAPQLDGTDVADVLTYDKRFDKRVQHSYSLNNDLYVKYKGRDFVRSYAEGGLTAYDYSWWPSTSISRFFSRLILSTLSDQRKRALDYDHKRLKTETQKARTLVTEWSGANDLITVNAHPSKAEADRAIDARIANLRKLISQGYRNFSVCGLPDLSLTPRFKNKVGPTADAERQQATEVSEYFNRELERRCNELKSENNNCKIDYFDINKLFTQVYNDTLTQTGEYKGFFDAAKLRQPFTTSNEFNLHNGISHATGFMFWDDVHPTAEMHELLAQKMLEEHKKKYIFAAPKPQGAVELCSLFRQKYNEKLGNDFLGFFGGFRDAHPPIQGSDSQQFLVNILRHALYEGGKRTRAAIEDLGWIDSQGRVDDGNPHIREALKEINAERSKIKATVGRNGRLLLGN